MEPHLTEARGTWVGSQLPPLGTSAIPHLPGGWDGVFVREGRGKCLQSFWTSSSYSHDVDDDSHA